MDKRITRLIRTLEQQGARIKSTKSGWMVFPPDTSKEPVTLHKTPSDTRWYKNAVTRLRRAGFRVE